MRFYIKNLFVIQFFLSFLSKIFMMEYKIEIDDFQKIQKLEKSRKEKGKEDFADLCYIFLKAVDENTPYSEFHIIMDFNSKIKYGLSKTEKNLFFEKQIHLILLNFFINPTLLDEQCYIFLPRLLITLYEMHDSECSFFLSKDFLDRLITEATTYPEEGIDHYKFNQHTKRFKRINELLKNIVKKHHKYIPIPFIIENYVKSLSNIHDFSFLSTFREIIKTEEAIFEYCAPVYKYLNTLFNDEDYYLEKFCYLKIMCTLFKKGIKFQNFFHDNIQIENLFKLLSDENDDLRLIAEAFKMYTLLLNQETMNLALLSYDIIDHSALFKRINENAKKNISSSVNEEVYFVSVCNFYQSILNRFPQFFNSFNLNYFNFFFLLCKLSYKVKVEAIKTMCMICCLGPSDYISFLVENGFLDQIFSIIDECHETLYFIKTIKVIFDYSIVKNNHEIQDAIFQDYYISIIDNIVQKSEFSDIANIWNLIIKEKNDII